MSDDQFQLLMKQLTAIRHSGIAIGLAVGLLLGHMLGGSMNTVFSRLMH
jgi:hypothetical protein